MWNSKLTRHPAFYLATLDRTQVVWNPAQTGFNNDKNLLVHRTEKSRWFLGFRWNLIYMSLGICLISQLWLLPKGFIFWLPMELGDCGLGLPHFLLGPIALQWVRAAASCLAAPAEAASGLPAPQAPPWTCTWPEQHLSHMSYPSAPPEMPRLVVGEQ